MSTLLYKYLCCLHVPHTRSGVTAVYDSVPDRNSLYGFAEMLEAYKITPRVMKLDPDDETSLTAAVPCLVQYSGGFAILKSVDGDKVTVVDENGEKTVDRQDFFSHSQRVVLKGEPDASSAEPEYKTNLRTERTSAVKRVLMICGLVFLFLVALLETGVVVGIWGALALLINLGGIYVTYLLMLKQLHVESRAADHLCSIIKKSHCDSPKLQAASTVLGMVTLAEIGMGFFIVNTLVLLLFPALLKSVAVLSAVGLLFSFWSVWYQRTQAKTWCTLCLITLTLMWLQAGVYLGWGIYCSGGLLSPSLVTVMAFYGVVILGLSYLAGVIERAIDDRELRKEYDDLRRAPGVMKLLISQQPVLVADKNLESSMVFGNPDAKLQLTVFANPYCIPCSRMHARLAEYLSEHPGSASVRYTMTYFSDDKSKINRYLIAAYQKFGPEKAWDILTDWYANGRSLGEEYFSSMGLDPDSPEVSKEFDTQLSWRKASGLTATPILIVDGHKVPHDYTIDDLRYLT